MGGYQGDLGRQVHEVAGKQLEVGVDRTDLKATSRNQLGQACALRTGEAEVEPAGNAVLKDVQMLRQRQHRLQHVQAVYPLRIHLHQRLGQEVGLLLVVALEANAIT